MLWANLSAWGVATGLPPQKSTASNTAPPRGHSHFETTQSYKGWSLEHSKIMAQKFTNIDKCRGRQVMDNNEGTELEKSCPPKEDSFDSVPYRKESRWSDIPILQGNLDTRDLCAISKFLKIGNSFLLLFIFHGAKEKMMLKWIEHCVLPVGDP